MDIFSVSDGITFWGVHPGLAPNIGIPSEITQYGTMVVIKGTDYPTVLYMSVHGQMAIYAVNGEQWRIILR